VPSAADTRTRSTRLPRSARRRQIAERAGVSKPVLYQHFPGKLELYLALLDEHAQALVGAVREALESTTDNKQRVAATIAAYFRFVDEDGGAFRLVFESDLTNQGEVRERVEGVTAACAEAISEVIRDDAGLPQEEARLLAVGLTGMAQVAARYWLATEGSIPRDAAARLLASLSWRGIGGFPRTGEPH
jgi:AcrR family transcriptional regulator